MGRLRFTEEEDNFLRENYNLHTYNELSIIFKNKFGKDVSPNTLSKHCGIKLGILKSPARSPHFYTKEEEQFIYENSNMNLDDLVENFNKRFDCNLSYASITQKRTCMGLKKYNIVKFTDEMHAWLQNNIETMKWEDLHTEFCKRFNVDISLKGLNRRCYTNGIYKYYRHHYTDEERLFLINNLADNTYLMLTDIFNKQFNTNVTLSSIQQQCLTFLKIKRGINKFAHNKIEIGSEVCKENDRILVKISDIGGNKRKEDWVDKHRMIYENLHGKIPENSMIIFLDSDHTNFDPENLYCIDRKIHIIMVYNKWYTSSRDNTLAAIKWCELYYTLYNSRND